jgi:uncharacterized protein (DUF362 family)
MPKVAVVKIDRDAKSSLKKAVKLIGDIADLNVPGRSVVVKVGLFDPKTQAHSSVEVVGAIADMFDKAPRIFLAESDNYRGKGSDRLQKWKDLFTDRVVPFNLSDDTETRKVKISDEEIPFSHVLFEPNVFVSTHILRTFDKGSIIKNLLGLIPDRKKARFHKKLEATLLDAYEAIGGIDLAVLDGTYAHVGTGATASTDGRIRTNVMIVGRDAVAVEAVGAYLVGLKPEELPVIREAVKRGLGEANLDRIEALGVPLEEIRQKISQQLKH